MERFVIIGAGPTGLGAARRLAAGGHHPVVLEAASHAGGLSRSVQVDGFTWDMGVHVQTTSRAPYAALLQEVMGEDFVEHARDAQVACAGSRIPYPFQYNTHLLPSPQREACMAGLREAARVETDRTDFATWCRSAFGSGVAEQFLLPYNRKVWTLPPTELSCDWMADRVPPPDLERIERNARDGRPDGAWGPNATFLAPRRGGTGTLWRRVAEELPQGVVRWGASVDGIDLDGRTVTAGGETLPYDQLLCTVPLKRLAQWVGSPECRAAAQELAHTSVHLVGLGFREAPRPAPSWLYAPGGEAPFYRATPMHAHSALNTPAGCSGWLCEIATPPGASIPADTALEVELALRRLGLVAAEAERVHTWQTRLHHGYPIPTHGRDAALATLLPAFEEEGVYSRGRFGAWRYEEGNQDHSYVQGLEVAEHWLGGPAPTAGEQ